MIAILMCLGDDDRDVCWNMNTTNEAGRRYCKHDDTHEQLVYYIRLALALCAAKGHRTFCCAALL
jgi:hypothetical protein